MPSHSRAPVLRPDAVRGVLFDMDGLLLDSERLYTQAFRDACAEFEQPFREDVWLQCIGTTDVKSREIIARGFGPDFPINSVLRRFRERFEELQSRGIAPMPGAVALLAQLHKWRVPIGLVTSTGRVLAGHKLHRARLADYFVARVCGGEARAGKPEPAPYRLGAKLLGLPIADCLVLEDSENGVRAGVAAGAQVVQVPDQVTPSPEIVELGHTIHENLQQTLEVLRAARD